MVSSKIECEYFDSLKFHLADSFYNVMQNIVSRDLPDDKRTKHDLYLKLIKNDFKKYFNNTTNKASKTYNNKRKFRLKYYFSYCFLEKYWGENIAVYTSKNGKILMTKISCFHYLTHHILDNKIFKIDNINPKAFNSQSYYNFPHFKSDLILIIKEIFNYKKFDLIKNQGDKIKSYKVEVNFELKNKKYRLFLHKDSINSEFFILNTFYEILPNSRDTVNFKNKNIIQLQKIKIYE